jgi:phage/plasmid-associated DNA primase
MKICNNNKEHFDYYFSFLGYSMTGDSEKIQEFYYIRGQKASNGKSMPLEVLTKIMPNYVVKLENNLLESTYGSRHKEISTWKGIRLGWVNELTKKKQDADFIKDLADGTAKRHQVMYGTMDNMNISLKLCIVSNNTFNTNADKGIARRLRILQFDSEFIDDLKEDNYETHQFIKNSNLAELLKTKYKHAFMDLIFQYSKKCYSNKDDLIKLCKYPDDWKQQSEDVVEQNNRFKEFFEENIESVKDGEISNKDLKDILSTYREGEINFKDELVKMKIIYKYDSQLKKDGKKGWWIGIRKVKEEPETD